MTVYELMKFYCLVTIEGREQPHYFSGSMSGGVEKIWFQRKNEVGPSVEVGTYYKIGLILWNI